MCENPLFFISLGCVSCSPLHCSVTSDQLLEAGVAVVVHAHSGLSALVFLLICVFRVCMVAGVSPNGFSTALNPPSQMRQASLAGCFSTRGERNEVFLYSQSALNRPACHLNLTQKGCTFLQRLFFAPLLHVHMRFSGQLASSILPTMPGGLHTFLMLGGSECN